MRGAKASACFLGSIALYAFATTDGMTQQTAGQKCTTVLQCSELAVKEAMSARADLKKDKLMIEQLRDQLNKFEAKLSAVTQTRDSLTSALGGGRILAIAEVEKDTSGNSTLGAHSNGVTFDSKTGVLTFPNPENLIFVPVISHYESAPTTMHYIKAIGSDYVIVMQVALDASARVYAPCCFTAAIIGFQTSIK